MKKLVLLVTALTLFSFVSCSKDSSQNFGKDLALIEKHDTPIVLKSEDSTAQIVISPKHQGRVLTSTATGPDGTSNGWLDYNALSTGKGSPGGEDRIWLGPIGSKHSLFYPHGGELADENWRVPPALATGSFPVLETSEHSALFQKKIEVSNHQGTNFQIQIDRKVTLYSTSEVNEKLGLTLENSLPVVGFESQNKLTNLGDDWSIESGMVTPWILGMFRGTEKATAIFPTQVDSAAEATVHTYLYPLEKDRLQRSVNAVFYKADGRYRSKIGLPKELSKDIIASYTPEKQRLTIIKFTFENAENYPIASEKSAAIDIPGDVTNSYNHGNMDGSLLDPASFYELETAAAIKPLKHGESISHSHSTFHFVGSAQELSPISQQLLGLSIEEIEAVFE